MSVRYLALLASIAMITACSPKPSLEDGQQAGLVVPLMASSGGAPVGTAAVLEGQGGVTLVVTADGVPPGTHGVHLHAVGRCDGPDFKSAGPHWNPAGKQHGRDNPLGAHLGDLPNFEVTGLTEASLTFPIGGLSLASLADDDGTSLVIHAKPDDYRTDPSGNSGDRIACAVLAPPKL